MRDRYSAHIAHIAAAFTRRGEATAVVRPRFGAVPVLFPAIILLFSFIFIHLLSSTGWSLTPSGTIISNTAQLTYTNSLSGNLVTAASNTVSVTSTIRRTTAVIEYLQYVPPLNTQHVSTTSIVQLVPVTLTSYSPSGNPAGPFVPMGAPVPAGSTTPIDLTQPVPLVPPPQFHTGEPAFVRLTDGDQNNDPAVAETVVITVHDETTGDGEVVRLTETGPNTGVFTGFIQSTFQPAATNNGLLNSGNNSRVTASYTDIADSTDTHTTSVMIDPYGMVFNSSTGQPVDGVIVTIVDVSTGNPAVVYGDDGISTFPASVTTGGTAMDSSGKTYSLSSGMYRYPFIKPGNYRLGIQPPALYKAPSTVATAVLQALPNGPFAIAEPGSRDEAFIVNPGPAIHIDIPIDPLSSRLYLIKAALKDTAAVGDFVPYKLTVENLDKTALVPGVTITDRLPAGFRYRKGSARLNNSPGAEPVISEDGRSVTFTVGDLGPAATADIGYVVEVGAGASLGKAVNTAMAYGSLGVVSNSASAVVLVIEDLFMSRTTIVGRVLEGCGDNGRGIAGARIFLEDGTYVVTDRNGMYHFAAVRAGTHVVQLDTVTVPAGYEIKTCEENTRFAGTPFSQFVDLQGGSLWRADFHLAPLPPKVRQSGEVGLELKTSLVTTLTTSINAANSGPGASLATFETCTLVSLCFGEMNVRSSPAAAKTTDTGATNRDDVEYSAMVPLKHAECCVPGANCRYTAAYMAQLHVGAVPVRNLRLIVMLPDGVTYTGGSSSLNSERVTDPDVADGVLTYRLGERSAGWEGAIVFLGTLPAQGVEGNLATKAFLVFDTPDAKGVRTPVADTNLVRYSLQRQWSEPDAVFHPRFETLKASLSRTDRNEIENIVQQLRVRNIEHITITGHADSDLIRPGASKEFPDNYALSLGRAAKVAHVVAVELKLSPDQISIEGKGADEPIATNKTAEGRAQNRRVELRVDKRNSPAWTYVRNDKETSGPKTMSVTGLPEGEAWVADQQGKKEINAKTMPEYDIAWMEKQQIGLSWLWPNERYHPPIPSVNIEIKLDPSKPFKLFLNGAEVDVFYLDTTTARSDNRVAVVFWRGVPLTDGDNLFEAVEYDENNAETARLKRVMHYSGSPVKVEIVPAKSQLMADGRSSPVIAVLLTDREGHPAREGLMGEYSVNPPYLPLQRAEDLQKNPLTAPTNDRLKYHVGEDGIALIELQPTTQTGEATLRFLVADGTSKEVRAWLKPGQRDWVLVGLAEGTLGYDVVKGNMETFIAGNGDDQYYEEDRLAFYAKGSIKGEWLLTLAYDSKKETTGQPGLYQQTIDPNKFYTLYGDGTMQGNDAMSEKHLYVKLERDEFYALFGDFNADLSVTELSRYNRSFTGIKSELKTKQFEYSAFIAETNQAHVRDEFQGDGTSGLYHLSRKNIVLNSETITIESRDRFKSEVIVSTQQMARNLDYTIDYEAGTIFFKAPINSRDGNFNPVFIVAEYESFNDYDTKYNYGGRAAVHVLDNRAEVGATYVHEGQVGGSGNLGGIDAKVRLSESDTLRAEAATTKTDQIGGVTKGAAYLAELQHHSETLEGKVYVREQAPGFGLGQQNVSETGTRKVGTDLNYRINKSWTAGGEVFEQNNLSTGDVRDMAELRGNFTLGRFNALAGIRRAEDTLSTSQTASFGQTQRSDQFFVGANYQMTEKLSVRVRRDQSLGANDNVDFPTRTTVGADYKLNDKSTIFADQEWTQGTYADTQTSRVGIRTSPWTGGQIGSTVEQQATENGVRLFSTTGLKQTWQVTKQWSVDGSLDRSQTIHNTTSAYTVNANVPPASGSSEDFTAVSLGVGYRQEKWSWTARVEKRTAETEDKYGLFAGANGEVRNGLGLAAGLQAFQSLAATGEEKQNNDLRFALVYRPFETRVIVLDRLDFLVDQQHGGTMTRDNNQRVVNNFVANIKMRDRTQVSVQYASKYVQETIDQNDYRGYTDLIGIEGRYDVTKKWDVGLRGMRLCSWSLNQERYGTGASVGFNAGRNIWISLGYNFIGFRDRDFSRADFTSEGPFITMRLKFDQVSVRDAVKWVSGQ
jgi:uncharacterized repeat protein (TIGR01451 family)